MVPIPFKTIFEVRFKPELRFYDRRVGAASALDGYPVWEYNPVDISLSNKEMHYTAGITSRRISYDQDNVDVELARKNIGNIAETLLPALNVEVVTRVGLRTFFLIGTDIDFDSLVSVIDTKMLSNREDLRELLPGSLTDLAYRVDLQDDESLYHLRVGPVTRSEIRSQIPAGKKNFEEDESTELEQFPEVSVLIDFDIFREDVSSDEIVEFVDTGCDSGLQLATQLADYLFSEKVKPDDNS